jgi:hypothetical protein
MPNRSSIVKRNPYPLKHVLHYLSPARRGRKVTVCIAIGCDCRIDREKPKLILISDRLISLGYTSTESAFKTRFLCEGWSVLVAGDDITHARAVVGAAQRALKDNKDTKKPSLVLDVMTDSYHLIRRRQIEHRFLKTYDMSMEDFKAKGKKVFPESHHLNLLYEIERFDLGCQFLVSGFSSNSSKHPCFFMVENPGVASIYDDFGYCAIGSGSINAMAHLARRDQNWSTTYERSLYNGIAAKHLAERASGVGPDFTVVVEECGSATSYFPEDHITKAIAEIWKEEESVIPRNLDQRIADILKK